MVKNTSTHIVSETDCCVNFVCAILKQAVDDVVSKKTTNLEEVEMHREKAKAFLCSDRLDYYCSMIRIDADAFRTQLVRNKILNKEDILRMKIMSIKNNGDNTNLNLNLNEMARQVHSNACDKGWWDEERGFGEIIALCHSELSEALEEFRDGNAPAHIYYNNKKPDKPEGIPIELADCIIRILDYCGKENINIDHAIKIKHEYNKTRPLRHGGKKI